MIKKNLNSKVAKFVLLICVIFMVAGASLGMAAYKGKIILNHPSSKHYPVRGVDVSAYQGEIDWDVLEKQEIDFAFVKATEGSSFVDRRFIQNYEEARKTDLRIGAYHFFSFDSSGKTQAENFIKNVPVDDEMLPPVVDFEFYGDKEKNLPDKEEARQELRVLLKILTQEYGKKPVIYSTMKAYNRYIAGDFKEYDIWIRDVLRKPSLKDKREWTFWQYTSHEVLKGYHGDEKFIDMNVFHGTKSEFQAYGNAS